MAKATSEELLTWQERVKACQASKLSMKGWCRENSINPSAFQYWWRKFNKQSASAAQEWAEVTIIPEAKKSSNLNKPIILRYNDFSLEIPEGFNKATLAEVISAIKSVC